MRTAWFRPKIFAATFLSVLLALHSRDAAAGEPAITAGSEAQARAYYQDVISKQLSFDATPGTTTLDNLLDFIGYPTSGAKVEALDPDVLMNPARASSSDGLGIPARGLSGATLREGDILVARFFAPKIVNINVPIPKAGWRKLVRLRVRPDSRAARIGIESAVILFNFFAPIGQPPFTEPSINTQVMLLAPKLPNRLFWLDFDPNGKLSLALNASFDAADLSAGGNRDYFVPDGCNDCHGSPGNFRPPIMNYLDTDHWFDRLDNDFAALKNTDTALVFDAHTNDFSQSPFAAAFDVIRRFNEEALLQNASVHPDSFEAQAARTWLRLHAQSDDHFPPVARSLNDSQPWVPSEAEGLNRLNRYCFRCHGSVRFSVFDRQAVVDRAGVMRQRINPSQQQAKIPGFKMPPDRTLDPAEMQALNDFLKSLK